MCQLLLCFSSRNNFPLQYLTGISNCTFPQSTSFKLQGRFEISRNSNECCRIFNQLKKCSLSYFFKGKKSNKCFLKLAALNIEVNSSPANMIHIRQSLDLIVNGKAKRFIKDQFFTRYLSEIPNQMESGGNTDDIAVDLRLSALKPQGATRLVNFYKPYSTVPPGGAAGLWELTRNVGSPSCRKLIRLASLLIRQNEILYSLILAIFHETFKLPEEFSVIHRCITLRISEMNKTVKHF